MVNISVESLLMHMDLGYTHKKIVRYFGVIQFAWQNTHTAPFLVAEPYKCIVVIGRKNLASKHNVSFESTTSQGLE